MIHYNTYLLIVTPLEYNALKHTTLKPSNIIMHYNFGYNFTVGSISENK